MWVVLSDIHGNLEALEAVVADMAKYPVSRIICLGDVLGYGPNPVECLEAAMDWDVVLLGNHDQAAMFDPEGFGVNAERAILWTRAKLEASGRDDLWDFLAERPRSHKEGDFLFVHGSPRNTLNEYLFPEDIHNNRKMQQIGALMQSFCFNGHSHVPGVYTEPDGDEGEWQYTAPEDLPGFHRLDGRKTIINVGSVGQPRDGNWRACYATVDGWDVSFHRVEYDVDATVEKIHAIPELANFLGDRLREGR
jgi:diadenosine tetraphosphatase ApaH/serine/threonine PP2A family protein phosphatase